MVEVLIANIAKPPGFSTSNAPSGLAIPLWSSTIQSIRTRGRETSDHRSQPRGRVEQAASAQARKRPPDNKGSGGECVLGILRVTSRTLSALDT